MQLSSFYYDHVQSLREEEEKARLSKLIRLQQVRQQEALRAKEELQASKQRAAEKDKLKEKENKFNEYIQKLKEIQNLTELKNKNLNEIGEAHREAEQAKREKERMREEKQAFAKKFEENIKRRENIAFEALRKENLEKQAWKEEALRIKKEILKQESIIAHEQARDFRGKNPEKIKEEPFFQEKIPGNPSKTKKRLDFKNTHFHNPLIQCHDLENQKENAMDLANIEREKAEGLEKTKMVKKEKDREKSRKRGKNAMEILENQRKNEELEKKLGDLMTKEKEIKVKKEVTKKITVVKKTMQVKQDSKKSEKELEKAFLNTFARKTRNTFDTPIQKQSMRRGLSSRSLGIAQKNSLSRKKNQSFSKEKPEKISFSYDNPLKITDFSANSPQKHETHSSIFERKEDSLEISGKRDDLLLKDETSLSRKEVSQEAVPSPKYEQPSLNKSDEKSLSDGKEYKESPSRNEESSSNLPDLQHYISEQEAYLEKLERERKQLRKNTKEISFLESLHYKENSFINSPVTNDFPQEKAHKLLEKFLGNDSFAKEKEENFVDSKESSLKKEAPQDLIVEQTPLKNTESDLSYSISQIKSPFLEKEDTFTQEKEENQEGLSLAELFRRKKCKLAEKLDENRGKKDETQRNEEFKAKTKEELAKLRKEMMKKPKFLKKKEETHQENDPKKTETNKENFFSENKDIKDDPRKELMERLALGGKVKVGKKEMKALTSKNYEKLPEVRKKKELEEKKLDFKKRQENAKKLQQKVREQFVKK